MFDLVVFRRFYGLDRAQIAALPLWERLVLREGARQMLGGDVTTSDGGASVIDGGPGTSAADIQRLIG